MLYHSNRSIYTSFHYLKGFVWIFRHMKYHDRCVQYKDKCIFKTIAQIAGCHWKKNVRMFASLISLNSVGFHQLNCTVQVLKEGTYMYWPTEKNFVTGLKDLPYLSCLWYCETVLVYFYIWIETNLFLNNWASETLQYHLITKISPAADFPAMLHFQCLFPVITKSHDTPTPPSGKNWREF